MEIQIINLTPVPMIIYREQVIFANLAALELLGYDHQYIVQKKVWELFSGEYREYIRDTAQQRLHGPLPQLHYETKVLTKHAEERWVNVISTSLTINNELMGLITLFDITEKKKLEEELAIREKMWTDMFNRHSEIMLFIDAEDDGKIIDANPAAARFYGYSQDTLRTMKISDINTLAMPTINKEMKEAMQSNKNSFYFVHRLANGELRHVQVSAISIHTKGKDILFSIVTDITEQLMYSRSLEESEARYRFITENSTDMITRIDQNGSYDFVSEASYKLTGFLPEEIIGHRPLDFAINPEDEEDIRTFTNQIMMTTDVVTITHRMRKKDGDIIWLETTAKKITEANGQYMGVLMVSRDVTERRQLEEELKERNNVLTQLSTIDVLTGIPNRRALDQYIAEVWNAYDQMTVIMIDIDSFKKYNDAYGHLQGDECLQKVAQCLVRSISSNQNAYRFGGEEFVVVLPGMNVTEAQHIAEQLRLSVLALEIPHLQSDVAQYVTVSLGVSDSLQSKSITDLIEKADKALYHAKRSGCNQVIVFQEDILSIC